MQFDAMTFETTEDPGVTFTGAEFREANQEDLALDTYIEDLASLNVGESVSLEWPDMIFTRRS